MKKLISLILILCTCLSIVACDTATAACEHVWEEEIITPATSVQKGSKRQTCTKCDATQTVDYDAPVLTSEEVYDLAEKSVGEITIYNKNGTEISVGTVFAISEDGRLLTNYHVIEDGYSAKVKIDATEYTVSQILAYDMDIDLAVLKINAYDLTPVKLMKEGVKGGATVYAVGSSEGYTLSFSTGVVASPNREIDNVQYIQHEAAISHGNSGGPLFNAYGEVIGINTLSNIEGQNLNFAISVKELDNLTYGTALTFAEYYDKECDPLKKLARLAISEGTWDSDGYYYTTLGMDVTDSGTLYSRVLYYYPDTGEYNLAILWDSDYFISIEFKQIGGIYEWAGLFGDSGYYMQGNFYPATFSSSTTYLFYSYTDAPSYLHTSMKELAASLARVLIAALYADLADINLTPYDLGFLNY
ncbi:MAG: trypsin-like peptidase domain-containing protein [Clostridia bacterium]|nr:trypsin-like peptidase domain-containing protein [Clostridia bacterium]